MPETSEAVRVTTTAERFQPPALGTGLALALVTGAFASTDGTGTVTVRGVADSHVVPVSRA